MTFEHLNTNFHHVRGKNKQPFTFWYCVDNFYPWKDIVGKKVSKWRSIAELKAFYGRKSPARPVQISPIVLYIVQRSGRIKIWPVAEKNRLFSYTGRLREDSKPFMKLLGSWLQLLRKAFPREMLYFLDHIAFFTTWLAIVVFARCKDKFFLSHKAKKYRQKEGESRCAVSVFWGRRSVASTNDTKMSVIFSTIHISCFMYSIEGTLCSPYDKFS